MCVVLIGCGGANAAEIPTCKSWLEQVCCVDVARFTSGCTEHQMQLIGEDWNPVPCPLPFPLPLIVSDSQSQLPPALQKGEPADHRGGAALFKASGT